MAFWDNVEKLRKEQNSSYRWLAQKMGVSETTVSSMRKANTEPRATEALKIAEALETSVEFLVHGKASSSKELPYIQKFHQLKNSMQALINSFKD